MCLWQQQASKKSWTPLSLGVHCMISSTLCVLPLHSCQTFKIGEDWLNYVIFPQWPHHLSNDRCSFLFYKYHVIFYTNPFSSITKFALYLFCTDIVFEMLVRSPWDIKLHGMACILIKLNLEVSGLSELLNCCKKVWLEKDWTLRTCNLVFSPCLISDNNLG